MSRERLHEWLTPYSSVADPAVDPLAVLDRIEAAMHPWWPDATCQGAAVLSSPDVDRISVYLYCNKTKARRVSDHLDRAFGVSGRVRLASDDDQA